ncbi:MAG TPA: ornithine cyclodeaminase family protein, partial [Burkholderiaceae bacterium]|nr:ornithine cyclodeaminase family protein [Burkholderiaceae bacterium]
MRTFDAAATRAALPFERLVPALRELFARGCEV